MFPSITARLRAESKTLPEVYLKRKVKFKVPDGPITRIVETDELVKVDHFARLQIAYENGGEAGIIKYKNRALLMSKKQRPRLRRLRARYSNEQTDKHAPTTENIMRAAAGGSTPWRLHVRRAMAWLKTIFSKPQTHPRI
jgi:hypothetical protein